MKCNSSMMSFTDIDTDLEALFITPHGLQRREERQITLRELCIAVRRGTREPADLGPNGDRRWKYTFAGVVVITDYHAKNIITSWNVSGYGIEIPKAGISDTMICEHNEAVARLKEKARWRSHTVVVVDQSGSMRTTDADKGITRSDLVWSTLALSFIAEKLKTGERNSTDVFSLVSMRDKGDVLLRDQPYDWVLYNKVVELFRTQNPTGAGNYFPALDTAQMLLRSNNYSGCALMLVFLSDGRPSDKFNVGEQPVPSTHSAKIRTRIGKIASRIGNRLTVGAIPLGKTREDEFLTLKALMEGAKEYGSHGFFQPPTLSANVLSTAMTSLSSTLTSTALEMSHRQCRRFRKEPVSNVGGSEMTYQFDRVNMREYEVKEADGRTRQYATIVRTMWIPGQGWRPFRGRAIFHSSLATGVAVKKVWFGEGAERLVKEFREVDACGIFVGPMLVAKDTKFLREKEDSNMESEREFHKVFCKTQIKAQKYARMFNEKMSLLTHYDEVTTPRLEFLDCSVYMIESVSNERHGYLVERMLDIKKFKYQKWNDNAGRVGKTLGGLNDINNELKEMRSKKPVLETFFEEEESEEDSEVDSDDSSVEGGSVGNKRGNNDPDVRTRVFGSSCPDTCYTIDDIPQAFSCFSYWQSKRRFLICDLQGVLNTGRHPPGFELTDPVIHHRDSTKESPKYGRSDKGLGGMVSFFDTHKCSNLCRMFKSRFQVKIEFPSVLDDVSLPRTDSLSTSRK